MLSVDARLLTADGRTISIPPQGLRIGRGVDNDLVIDDPNTSRHHASVVLGGDEFILADLHSTNGTLIGMDRIDGSQRLQPGDVIRIGSTVLTFVVL